LNFWLSQDRFQPMEWHLFGDFFTRFIVIVQPIWDRKYRAWTCSVVEILGLDSILEWHWTTQQVPNAEQRPLNISEHLGLYIVHVYLVFKRLKHKSLLRCKASHSHVFFSLTVCDFVLLKLFLETARLLCVKKVWLFVRGPFCLKLHVVVS
jgi:hypothetical protein